MAYSTSLPPAATSAAIEGRATFWSYRSVDDAATVRGAGYFTNGSDLGMRVGDFVFHNDTDAGTVTGSASVVTAVTAGGAATVAALT
jgi:hypothetical protein